ncbi:hypothetical protein TNCV_3048541 [Trichonephila clavipes]|nr:hypothetical protein TNCV_3048541 [Trichonephila clavipes]
MPKKTKLSRKGFRATNRSLRKQPPSRLVLLQNLCKDGPMLNEYFNSRAIGDGPFEPWSSDNDPASNAPNFPTTTMAGQLSYDKFKVHQLLYTMDLQWH